MFCCVYRNIFKIVQLVMLLPVHRKHTYSFYTDFIRLMNFALHKTTATGVVLM